MHQFTRELQSAIEIRIVFMVSTPSQIGTIAAAIVTAEIERGQADIVRVVLDRAVVADQSPQPSDVACATLSLAVVPSRNHKRAGERVFRVPVPSKKLRMSTAW
jgi:hypothetical protein